MATRDFRLLKIEEMNHFLCNDRGYCKQIHAPMHSLITTISARKKYVLKATRSEILYLGGGRKASSSFKYLATEIAISLSKT